MAACATRLDPLAEREEQAAGASRSNATALVCQSSHAITTDLKRLEDDLTKTQQDQSSQLAEIQKLRTDIEELKRQVPAKMKVK